MKRLHFQNVIVVWLSLICCHLQAQSVISSGNHQVKAEGFSLEGTIGEPLTITLLSNKQNVTQGFHQPIGVICSPCHKLKIEDVEPNFETVSNSASDTNFELDLDIIPNPAVSFVNIEINSDFVSDQMYLAIYDRSGKVLHLEKIRKEFDSIVKNIDTNNFQSGHYFLKVFDEKYSITKALQILK